MADIEDLYGHTRPETTMIYALPDLAKHRAALERLRRTDGDGATAPADTSRSQGSLMSPNPAQIQSLLLRVLAQPVDTRLGRGHHYFHDAVRQEAPDIRRASVMEAVWALIGQGLVYIDYSQPAAENWSLHLTDAGRAAADDEEVNPDNPENYLSRLSKDVPELSVVARQYTVEGLRAYNARLYRASAVMLGVASEAAVLEVASSFATTLPEVESRRFMECIGSPRQNITAKFSAFRAKLQSRKNELPKELKEGLDLTVHSVADLLRTYRNDAGHPTDRTVDRTMRNTQHQRRTRGLRPRTLRGRARLVQMLVRAALGDTAVPQTFK